MRPAGDLASSRHGPTPRRTRPPSSGSSGHFREGLLAALPGYKGPDVYSRGEHVEDKAFYFLPELEQVIREWVATVYHRRPHGGLVDPTVPGLELSPLDMFEHGCGPGRAPAGAGPQGPRL